MPVAKALEMARQRGYDLVEVAPTSSPPVCRLVDYGKFKYEQARKEREARKKQKAVLLREVRLRPAIGAHDFAFKVRLIKKLLDEGDKVNVRVLFRGRAISHPELGTELLQRVIKELEEIATVEKAPAMDVRSMNMILSSVKESKIAKKVADA
jgi:translation initiation factor IF-3